MALNGQRVAPHQAQLRDARASHFGIHAGFPVPGDSSVGFDPDQTPVGLEIELQRLNGRDLHRAKQRGGQRLVVLQPCPSGQGQRQSQNVSSGPHDLILP